MAELIDRMQKRNISAGRYGASEDRFQFVLLPALLLLLFSFWLPERKKSWLLILPLVLLTAPASWAGTADDVNRGNHAYKKGKYDRALKAYRDAQIKAPNNPVVSYDLGNALHQAGQHDEAEKAYQKTLAGKDPALRAKAFYNLGNNYVKQQKYEDAVKSYHQALKLKPRDEDTIYNLSQTLALMKNPPQQKQDKNQNQKDQEKNPSGQKPEKSQGQAGQEKQSGKDKDKQDGQDEKGQAGGQPQAGPDDKGEHKADAQAGQEPSGEKENGRVPKPGEMRKEDAENVLDAVREAERNAQQERMKQMRQQSPSHGEDW